MNLTHLLIDVSNVAYRWFHALAQDSFTGDAVVYGVLRELLLLRGVFPGTSPIFCFDVGVPARRKELPDYQSSRQNDPVRDKIRSSIETVRTDVLARIGFQNNFGYDGYEADDLIALLCQQRMVGSGYCIVSTDHDLYQLLTPGVTIWNSYMKSQKDHNWFTKEHDLIPEQWAAVKALTGDPTDCIPGVPSVGLVRAKKYLWGELPPTSAAAKAIALNDELIDFNLRLTTVPYSRLPAVRLPLMPDTVRSETWNAEVLRQGLPQLVGEW